MIKSIQLRDENGDKIEMSMDGDHDFILDSIDWDGVSVDIYKYKVPYQIGQSISGVSIGTREPTIIGYIVGRVQNSIGMKWNEYYEQCEKDIERKKRKLNRFISPFKDIDILVGEYRLKCRPEGSVKYSREMGENNEVLCKFQIDLFSPSAVFETDETKQSLFVVTDGMFSFPWELEENNTIMGEIKTNKVIAINNEGDFDSGCIIKVIALNGDVVNPKFYNVQTGDFIRIVKTISYGDYVIINTNKDEESIIYYYADGTEENIIAYVDEGSSFLQIKAGEYVYSYAAEDGTEDSAEMSVEYKERYFNIDSM